MHHVVARWMARRGGPLFAAGVVAAITIAGAEAWAQQTTVKATPPAAPVQRTIDCGAGAGDRNTCEADTSSASC